MKNKLNALMAKKGKLIIPAEKTTDGKLFDIELQGLSFPDLAKFATFSENKDTEGATNFLLYTTLRKAIPSTGEEGLTDEDLKKSIDEMDGMLASEIVKKVMELSGMEVPAPKKDLGAEQKVETN